MGVIRFGERAHAIDADDRVIAHLQAVVIAKLRRGESFPFTWAYSPGAGSGSVTAWLYPGMQLSFTTRSKVKLNRDWLTALMQTANSVDGLQIVAEPATGQDAPEGEASVRKAH
jgi:hypothetical protein